MDHLRHLMGGLRATDFMPRSKMAAISDAAATAAVSLPLWMPWLKQASEVSAFLLPIAGVGFIAVRAICVVLITRKKLRE